MGQDRSTFPIKDVLEKVLSKNEHIRYEIKIREAMETWGKIADDYLLHHTKAVLIKERKLFIHTDSAVLANELSMKEREYRKHINSVLKLPLIKKIVFRSGFILNKDTKKPPTVKKKKELTVKTLKQIDSAVENIKEDELKNILKKFLRSTAERGGH